jgi:hypothetical protein
VAAGPLDLARRVGRFAAEGGAAPGGAALDQFLWGLAQVARGARLLATDRALLRAAALPTALTLGGAAALSALVASQREGHFFDGAFALFVAISSMPPSILWRQWVRVGLESRRAAGATPGEEERPGEPYLRLLLREGVKTVRQGALVAFGLLPVAVAVELVPWVGHGVTVAVGAAWAWYWVVLDALEIPVELRPGKLDAGPPTWFERALGAAGARSRWLLPLSAAGRLSGSLARPWRHQAAFTERHPWPSAGFALAAVAFLAIPVVGVFFRAVAIAAATRLVVEREERAASPEPADGPGDRPPSGPGAPRERPRGG